MWLAVCKCVYMYVCMCLCLCVCVCSAIALYLRDASIDSHFSFIMFAICATLQMVRICDHILKITSFVHIEKFQYKERTSMHFTSKVFSDYITRLRKIGKS